MQYNYLFGPVPSRRLGLSLGVDIVTAKTCSLDCVYCESGKTTELTTERKKYLDPLKIIAELDDYLSTKPKLDYITFSGSGEPTLNSGIKEIIDYLKHEFPDYKIALLTNSTLFTREDVRNDVAGVDLVVASVDAMSETLFNDINRPEKSLEMNSVIDGLKLFRSTYNNQLWIEIFIVPGRTDSVEELQKIRNAVKIIQPDKIHLNSLDRPGTESWVAKADEHCLAFVKSVLNDGELIRQTMYGTPDFDEAAEIEASRILNMLKRRPCTIDDLIESLGGSKFIIEKKMNDLVDKELIYIEKMPRGVFYKVKT